MSNLLNEITTRIRGLTDTPFLDAQVLLSHHLGKSKSWVLSHPEMKLTDLQQEDLKNSLDQLESGVPLPYILGHWEFYGLELVVSKDVLIPRPETELLVGKALDWLKVNPLRRQAIDMGTGSGCIAIALAVNVPDLEVEAVDISESAIMIARENAVRFHLLDRVEFVLGDLWEKYIYLDQINPSPFNDRSMPGVDLITANLPYIPTSWLHDLKIYGREPDLALDGGIDGMKVIRNFLISSPLYLRPGGLILMEVEASLASKTLDLVKINFPEAETQLYQDLAGLDRLIEIRQKNENKNNLSL